LAKGIIHIGANEATESRTYSECVGGNGANVLFIECDPVVAKECTKNAQRFGQRCLNACISNENAEGVEFYQSEDNGGMSSSLRAFDKHHEVYPGVEHSAVSSVRIWRFDDLVTSIPSGLIPEANLLTIDAQGMEYEILQGMKHFLTSTDDIEVAVVEVSHTTMYKDQRLGPDVDRIMFSYGFQCKLHCGHCDHCDRLYQRVKQ
jgi:FkbM family methyltransferase